MAVSQEDLDWNISIGYKLELADADRQVQDKLLYHGRLGGDLGALEDSLMFFYDDAGLSSEFVEHKFINGDTYEIAATAQDDDEFYVAYLSQSPAIFPVRVSLGNPVVLDMRMLIQIATDLGIENNRHDNFVAEFEDSNIEHRKLVFGWAKKNGYDGAIIVNDMTPEVAGGDWCFRTSYVAFYPKRQVRFAFDSKLDVGNKPRAACRSGV